ncbi:mutator family transposase [Rhodovulum kholense]|uniref:Mutator family transposase n=1 Tax=Rhodovulum kholense TaxID=453584 RepID=A0A8E2VGQ9_9RHOB|nr:mutator family transposase [Rhodovulum kholense]
MIEVEFGGFNRVHTDPPMITTNMDRSGLLAKHGQGDFLRAMARAGLPLIMEADVDSLIGAGRDERCGERTTWRNGYRARALDTRLSASRSAISQSRSVRPPAIARVTRGDWRARQGPPSRPGGRDAHATAQRWLRAGPRGWRSCWQHRPYCRAAAETGPCGLPLRRAAVPRSPSHRASRASQAASRTAPGSPSRPDRLREFWHGAPGLCCARASKGAGETLRSPGLPGGATM